MSNRELRSLGLKWADFGVPVQDSPLRTVYSKTLRSGTTYAQYRDTEEEKKKEGEEKYTAEMIMVEEKWLCHNGQPVGRISAEVLPPQDTHVGNLCMIPNNERRRYGDDVHHEWSPSEERTKVLFYPR
jgi:hypothetical protein